MVPERIALARSLAGIPRSDLDALAGLGRGHVSMIETGRRPNLEAKTAVALASVLGVTTDWLLTGEGKAPTKRAVHAAVERARAAALAAAAPVAQPTAKVA